jgi:two-component system chemotaxis response regulator CheB
VVVFGVSHRGVAALSEVLSVLPERFPAAIAIVQHRASQSGSLADVPSSRNGRAVRDAVKGDRLAPGAIFLAPAGKTPAHL